MRAAKPPADRIRNLIGRSLMQMMQQLAPSAGMGKHEELVETYAAHYLNPNNRHMRLFPDVLAHPGTPAGGGILAVGGHGQGTQRFESGHSPNRDGGFLAGNGLRVRMPVQARARYGVAAVRRTGRDAV